jgi:hypothetical protein
VPSLKNFDSFSKHRVFIGSANAEAPADEHGNRRLDDPKDFVRIEIAAALQRNIPVIPILLDGATIPGWSFRKRQVWSERYPGVLRDPQGLV